MLNFGVLWEGGEAERRTQIGGYNGVIQREEMIRPIFLLFVHVRVQVARSSPGRSDFLNDGSHRWQAMSCLSPPSWSEIEVRALIRGWHGSIRKRLQERRRALDQQLSMTSAR